MNEVLHSRIIERGASKCFQLDASSEAAMETVVSFYGLCAEGVLRKLEQTLGQEGWPWAVVLMRRELPLTAHLMEARGVHRNLPLMSYSFIRAGKPHDQGIPPSGILFFPSRGVARRLAKVSPVIRPWWPIMQNLSEGTTHLLIVDEPDPGLVAELSVDQERRCLESMEKDEKARFPLFDVPCARARYLLYTADALHASGSHEQFLYHARKIERYFPNHPRLRLQQAQALLMLSRWQEALDTNRSVLMQRPRLGGSLELHGLAAERLGLNRLAEACYRRCVAIDFCAVTAWRGLFRMHKMSRNLQGMLECIDPLEDLEQADAQYWIDVGEELIEAGRCEEGVLAMETALMKDPDHPACLNNYAFALVKHGRAKEAIPFCEAAMREMPDYPIFLDTHALILDQLGRHREALDVIDRVIAIEPDWQAAWVTKEKIRANISGAD